MIAMHTSNLVPYVAVPLQLRHQGRQVHHQQQRLRLSQVTRGPAYPLAPRLLPTLLKARRVVVR